MFNITNNGSFLDSVLEIHNRAESFLISSLLKSVLLF